MPDVHEVARARLRRMRAGIRPVDFYSWRPSMEAAVDWSRYRECPVCKAPTGSCCLAQSGVIVEGRPDGVRRELPRAHTLRPLRRLRGQ